MAREPMPEPSQRKPRAEIKPDFSKELASMDVTELNKVITNFRRHKAAMLEKIRATNPGFAMQASSEDHPEFIREHVLTFLEKIAKGETISPESMKKSYWDADTIAAWYNKGRKEFMDSSQVSAAA